MNMKSVLSIVMLVLFLVRLAAGAEGDKASTATAGTLDRMEWTVEGVAREALVYLPSSAKVTPAPVIFAFHGHGGSMRQAAGNAFHKLWPEAIVVYMQGLKTPGFLVDPQGKDPGWQAFAGDQDDRDLKFFDAVLATLKKDFRVDEKRIFSTGHSNGGGFTYLLWSERGDVFAAVAPGAAAWMSDELVKQLPRQFAALAAVVAQSAKKLRPLPVMHIAGEKDTLVKFAWQKATIDSLITLNGCGEGQPTDDGCTLYPSKGGTPVVTYIHPGGHTSPPGVPQLIVGFFKRQAKP